MKPILIIKDIQVRTSDESTVPFAIEALSGTVVGLFGGNGAGKTTLLERIGGKRKSGSVVFDGLTDFNHLCAYAPSILPFHKKIRVNQLEQMMAAYYTSWDHHEFKRLCETYDVDQSSTIGMLSLGQSKRLQLCVALSYGARLLLFDTILEGIDDGTRHQIIAELREYVYTHQAVAIVSSQDSRDYETLLDYVVYLKQGRVLLNADIENLPDAIDIVYQQEGIKKETEGLGPFIYSLQGVAYDSIV